VAVITTSAPSTASRTEAAAVTVQASGGGRTAGIPAPHPYVREGPDPRQRVDLEPRLPTRADHRHRPWVRGRQVPGCDAARRAGAHVGDQAAVQDQRGGRPRFGVEDEHQAVVRGETARRIPGEPRDDLHRVGGRAVQVPRLDVDLGTVLGHVQLDHGG
jgi:hypothetical protein